MKDELIMSYLNGECLKEELKTVEDWILNNQGQFNKLKFIWETSKFSMEDTEPDMDAAWNKIDPVSRQKVYPNKISARHRFIKIARIAAVVFIVVGLGYLLVQRGFNSSKTIAWEELSSGTERNVLCALPDGSKVWLNRNTKLSFPEEFKKTREVNLEGEAYFEVVSNPKKSFKVRTENTITEVLGTSFNIDAKSKEDAIEVTVITGLVAFYTEENEENRIVLEKHNKGKYSRKDGSIIKQVNQDQNFMAWQTNKLVFYKTPLAQVCTELSEHCDTLIIPGDSIVLQKNLSATFDNKSIREILDVIEITLDIYIKNNDDGILLYATE